MITQGGQARLFIPCSLVLGQVVLLIDLVVNELVHLGHEERSVVIRLQFLLPRILCLALRCLTGRVCKTPSFLHIIVLIKVAVIHVPHELLGIEWLARLILSATR